MVGAELVQLLGDLQESGPVALIIDDAPWADPPSLRALSFTLRRLQVDRMLTMLTMRSEDAPRMPPGVAPARPGPRRVCPAERAEHPGGARIGRHASGLSSK